MENEKITVTDQSTMEALIGCTSILQLGFSINYSYKKYRFKRIGCTVRVANRSFSSTGNDALQQSVKQAVLYMVDTFAALKDIKDSIPKPEGIPCNPPAFEFKKVEKDETEL